MLRVRYLSHYNYVIELKRVCKKKDVNKIFPLIYGWLDRFHLQQTSSDL